MFKRNQVYRIKRPSHQERNSFWKLKDIDICGLLNKHRFICVRACVIYETWGRIPLALVRMEQHEAAQRILDNSCALSIGEVLRMTSETVSFTLFPLKSTQMKVFMKQFTM